MKELTERQQRVVRAIQDWINEHGLPPTIRELGKRLGIKSLRGVTTHLDAIARKGYLQRKRGARGIRLLGGAASSAMEHAVRVPIVGRIAAGRPLLAEEGLEGQLVVDASLLGRAHAEQSPAHFALRVRGRSMQGAGILNGDYVIVRQQPQAENGEIVAVLIEGEATVKRLYRERGGRLRLQPDNPALEPLFVQPKHQSVKILGKVVGLFRKL
jgi:repressor LexA